MKKNREKHRTSFELRKGKRLLWRGLGRDMVRALRRLERTHGTGVIRIQVVFREGVLIAVFL